WSELRRSSLPAGREACVDAGIVITVLRQGSFARHGQRGLRCLEAWIGLERLLDQIAERLRVKQRPPLSRNVSTLEKLLRIAARNARCPAGGRQRRGLIARHVGRCGLLEVGADRAAAKQESCCRSEWQQESTVTGPHSHSLPKASDETQFH